MFSNISSTVFIAAPSEKRGVTLFQKSLIVENGQPIDHHDAALQIVSRQIQISPRLDGYQAEGEKMKDRKGGYST